MSLRHPIVWLALAVAAGTCLVGGCGAAKAPKQDDKEATPAADSGASAIDRPSPEPRPGPDLPAPPNPKAPLPVPPETSRSGIPEIPGAGPPGGTPERAEPVAVLPRELVLQPKSIDFPPPTSRNPLRTSAGAAMKTADPDIVMSRTLPSRPAEAAVATAVPPPNPAVRSPAIPTPPSEGVPPTPRPTLEVPGAVPPSDPSDAPLDVTSPILSPATPGESDPPPAAANPARLSPPAAPAVERDEGDYAVVQVFYATDRTPNDAALDWPLYAGWLIWTACSAGLI